MYTIDSKLHLTVNRSWYYFPFCFNFDLNGHDTRGAVSMSMCRHLQSDGAGGSDDKNVGERDARQGPAQCALQPVDVVPDCHHMFLHFSKPAGDGLEEREGDLRPNPRKV